MADDARMKKVKGYALSDDEMRKCLPGVPVQTVNEAYRNGFQFDPKGRAVLFQPVEDAETGHWQGLIRRRGRVEFFDSYGDNPEAILSSMPPEVQMQTGERPGELNEALRRLGLPVYKNCYPFQAERANVNSCGRHVICRLLYYNLSLGDYLAMIQKSGLSPDDFVSAVVYKFLHK